MTEDYCCTLSIKTPEAFSKSEKPQGSYGVLWTVGCLLLGCILTGVITGSVSAGYYDARIHNYIESQCHVLGSSYGQNSKQCDTETCAQWSVSYWNELTGNNTQYITTNADTLADAAKIYLEYEVGKTYTCYYQKDDFTLYWTIPYDNYQDIGYASIALLCVSPFLFLFYVCYFKSHDWLDEQ